MTEKPAPTIDPAPAETGTNPVGLPQEKMLTVKEAAFRLKKSPDAIYKWLRKGRLRGFQPGGRWCAVLVVESSVEQALRYSPGKA